MKYKICIVNSCTEAYSCKGLCGFHYKRQQTGVPLDRPKRVYHKGSIKKSCPTCYSTFQVQESLDRSIYCSRRCWGKTRTGEKNPRWQGGITGTDTEQRNRFNRELRELILARDNYTCQVCQTEDSGNLQIDHIKRWSEYPELRFELDNCRTLCRPCHYYITYKRKMPKSSRWGLLPRPSRVN